VFAQDTCYHCPFAHPGLCEALDLDEYHSVCYEHNSFQFAPLAPADQRPPENGEWDVVTANRIEGARAHPLQAYFGTPTSDVTTCPVLAASSQTAVLLCAAVG
jgi:phenylpropionate dioxygenase-like ring-hydroxylating dioxygenase large terminal subunit